MPVILRKGAMSGVPVVHPFALHFVTPNDMGARLLKSIKIRPKFYYDM